jgi:hypothetical protein
MTSVAGGNPVPIASTPPPFDSFPERAVSNFSRWLFHKTKPPRHVSSINFVAITVKSQGISSQYYAFVIVFNLIRYLIGNLTAFLRKSRMLVLNNT